MASYFGFDPGTFQPWALNLLMDALGQPGVARGMQVTQTASPSMVVQVNVDPIALDGVCFLESGSWCRIDANVALSVPNNTSGSTRIDAVVVQLDPTGVLTNQIAYVTGWTTGFNPQPYGSPASAGNELVLALVSVPNNASTITTSNIVNTPLVASAGTAPQNYPDAFVGSEHTDAHGSQPGVFVAIEALITSSATNGQTSFAPSLSNMQVLLAQGRIGGALEVGDFAGPNGWYWPKVRGSVSGLLPVLNVDPTSGIITTAQGAQAGEAVTVSYKYYDFTRDTKVRSGAMFHEKTSPYLVYQGEVVEDRALGLAQPLFDGSLGAYLLLNPGESIFFTDYLSSVEFPFLGGPGSTTCQVNVYDNTSGGSNTFTAGGGLPPPGVAWRLQWDTHFPKNPRSSSVYQLKLVSGIMAMCGVRAFLDNGRQVYVSGGLVNVQGQLVFLQNTSFTLAAPGGMHQSYVIYTDRFGNLTSGAAFSAGMDRTLGRVPVAAALQYGQQYTPGATPTSSSWGAWALPGSYLGWPTGLVMTGNSTAASPSGGMNNGFSYQSSLTQTDPNTVWATTASGDTLLISSVCSGLDGIFQTYGTTASYTVTLDQKTSSTVNVGGSSQTNVRVTLASSLPYGSHTVAVASRTASGGLMAGLLGIDVRVPATPAPPPGTLALAQVDVFGTSSVMRPSLARGAHFPDTNNSATFVVDSYRPAADPGIWLANNSSSANLLTLSLQAPGGYTLHYQAGPDKGIISLKNFSVDCYAVSPVMDTVAAINPGGNVFQVNISSGNLKNGSSSNTQVVLNAIDFAPYAVFVTDLRHFGLAHGHASELRGSTLLTPQGTRLDDGGLGVRAEQLRDRSVTSRKVAPTYKRVTATTSFSGFPGIYAPLTTTITVDVPSMLMVMANVNLAVPVGAEAQVQLAINGGSAGDGTTASNQGTASESIASTVVDMLAVPAGTHNIQVSIAATAGNQPYISTAARPQVLSVAAFAL